ncbi:hypothetical protein CRM22_007861 [Opisthorchis felineus]|uniref:Large ribosomal subunit protein P1 n=1 Tax=Opisthorchis felineus TaxID=147828 RepID=A0A4S2LDV5_OPIFE|nr:hypothetical protein CRM22_007861 [Opisthorchis felineus]
MSKAELACVYAALMLADDDIDVTADKIQTILKAANIKFVEPYLPTLFSNALHGKNIKDMLMNVGSAGSGPAATPVTVAEPVAEAPAADKKAAAEKKEESDADSDGSMGFDLFG